MRGIDQSKEPCLLELTRKQERALTSIANTRYPAKEPFEIQLGTTPAHGGRKVRSVSQTVKQHKTTVQYRVSACGQMRVLNKSLRDFGVGQMTFRL